MNEIHDRAFQVIFGLSGCLSFALASLLAGVL